MAGDGADYGRAFSFTATLGDDSLNGVYGDLTYEAVKKYQYQKGLHADGMAGTKTMSSLRKNTSK